MAITAVKLLPNGVISKASILDPIVDDLTSLDGRATALENAVYRISQKLTASASSIVFSGIPSTYRHLKIAYTARADRAVVAQWLWIRINGGAGATDYNWAYTQLDSTATVSKQTAIGAAQSVVGFIPGASATAGLFSSGVIDIPGWDSPHAGFLGISFTSQFLQDASNLFIATGGGLYKPVGPYTSVTLLPETSGNFVAGTEVTLEAR